MRRSTRSAATIRRRRTFKPIRRSLLQSRDGPLSASGRSSSKAGAAARRSRDNEVRVIQQQARNGKPKIVESEGRLDRSAAGVSTAGAIGAIGLKVAFGESLPPIVCDGASAPA